MKPGIFGSVSAIYYTVLLLACLTLDTQEAWSCMARIEQWEQRTCSKRDVNCVNKLLLISLRGVQVLFVLFHAGMWGSLDGIMAYHQGELYGQT